MPYEAVKEFPNSYFFKYQESVRYSTQILYLKIKLVSSISQNDK